jgi:hypothetical protein
MLPEYQSDYKRHNHGTPTQTHTLRGLQRNLLDAVRHLLFRRPRSWATLALFRGLDALTGSLPGFLTLLFGFLGGSLLSLLLLGLACFCAAKLLAPFLLPLGLDLGEQVAGGADLVADG